MYKDWYYKHSCVTPRKLSYENFRQDFRYEQYIVFFVVAQCTIWYNWSAPGMLPVTNTSCVSNFLFNVLLFHLARVPQGKHQWMTRKHPQTIWMQNNVQQGIHIQSVSTQSPHPDCYNSMRSNFTYIFMKKVAWDHFTNQGRTECFDLVTTVAYT